MPRNHDTNRRIKQRLRSSVANLQKYEGMNENCTGEK